MAGQSSRFARNSEWVNAEVIVGLVEGSEGVGAAAVLRKVELVPGLVRERRGSEEKHVLAEVGEARKVVRVGEVPNADGERDGGLVERRVRDEERLEPVAQRHEPITKVLALTCLESSRKLGACR